MALKELFKIRQQQPNRNLFRNFNTNSIALVHHHRTWLFLTIVLLCWQTASFAAGNSPGIGFKFGAQTMESPFDFDKTTRARFELEIVSPRFANDYFDLAFSFGGSSLGSYHDEFAGYDGEVFIEEYFSDHYSILDLRLAGRLYPFGDTDGIQPYIGAGLGYFWFSDSWEYEYYETYEDPIFPGVFYTYGGFIDGRDTLANGLFPFVTAGLTVPVSSNFDLLFEVQYHYDKEDSGFDFDGPAYMLGLMLRF